MPIKHTKISALADAGDPSLVQPSDWNANHDLSGLVAADIIDFDAAAIAAVGTPSPRPSDFQPPIVTGRYYGSPVIGQSDPVTLTADALSAFPIWFSHTETWTRIVVNVTTGSGSATEKLRLGLYASGADGLPGALIEDFGEISLETSGEKSLTISRQLTANTLYWLGQVTNDPGTTTMVDGYFNDFNSYWTIGRPSIAAFSTSRSFTYGALPDPFGTMDTDFLGAYIWLRKV